MKTIFLTFLSLLAVPFALAQENIDASRLIYSCNDYHRPHSISFGKYSSVKIVSNDGTPRLLVARLHTTGSTNSPQPEDAGPITVYRPSVYLMRNIAAIFVSVDRGREFKMVVYRDGTADVTGQYNDGKLFTLNLDCVIRQ